MADSPTLEPRPLASEELSQRAVPSIRGLFAKFLKTVDLLLSEQLRRDPPSALVRYRILAVAAAFLFLDALVVTVTLANSVPPYITGVMSLCYLTALILLRRDSSHMTAAMIVCMTLTVGSAIMAFNVKEDLPYAGVHTMHMLVPALATYLMGPRRGLIITLFTILNLGVLYPLYYTHLGPGALRPPDPIYWSLYVFSGVALLAGWALNSLHSAARHEAQTTLERTLTVLRDNESKLNSVFESTDDLVISLDAEGRLLMLNSAAKQAYFARLGREPVVGEPLLTGPDPEMREVWAPRLALALTGQRQRYEESYTDGGVRITFDTSVNPVQDARGRITGITVFARNITARKEAEARLGEIHRTLVDVSRQAGMAEIATGVLHNVGNTLNSVNVSTGLVIDQLSKSRLVGLTKAAQLMREHSTDLTSFLTEDPQGQKLPAYLIALSDQLQEERETMLRELRSLRESVDHIKSIVSMQQKHARAAGAVEQVAVPQLIDEALRLHAVSLERLGIHIERDYKDVTPIFMDRHRLLQILVNLLSNARDALTASARKDKRLTISVHLVPEEKRLCITVADNGIGIAPENLPRLFSQGFTTKKDGHGFGLHISAVAAMEMRGKLTCDSPGPDQGATFTLELPTEPPAA